MKFSSYMIILRHKVFNFIMYKCLSKSVRDKVSMFRWKERQNRLQRDLLLTKIKNSGQPIRVLFIISSLPMWRGQGLYNLLSRDSRFNPQILIAPFKRFNKEEALKYSKDISSYLLSQGIIAHNAMDSDFKLELYLKQFNPEIIFPCQPYDGIYGNILDFNFNRHRIYCYIPYALSTVNDEFAYNFELQNLCLKYYLPTDLHYKTARRIMANGAKNVKIVGEPDYDKFKSSAFNPWKEMDDGIHRKKIIWAPHFTINSNELLHRSSFLWLYDEMLKLAEEYKDKIQFAFKPHPNLHSILCNREDWGHDKTNQYYNLWTSMPNTQLEEGHFVDLFSHSDAMIHDSGSFTGEYLFVKKPVMFTTNNMNAIRKGADDFGLKCLDLHYVGKSVSDIRSFIEDVVLNENDIMKSEREEFYNNYLIPPNGRTVADNIYYDLIETLGLSTNK